jgi:tryptophan 2,3-dioxygenase
MSVSRSLQQPIPEHHPPDTGERPQRAPRSEPSRLTYWDYIRLDELLALSNPRTKLSDERVFIIFHQIAEMSLALIVGELEQLTAEVPLPVSDWKTKLKRVIAICGLFTHNVKALGRCIDREQFLSFREALSPASGFQSFQYRKMELMSARLKDLVLPDRLNLLPPDATAELLFEHLYWRQAISADRPSDERAMLLDFEARYLDELRNIAISRERRNLAARFAALPREDNTDSTLVRLLRDFDRMVNRGWRGAHHRLALALLADPHAPRVSTGGTNWRSYLETSNKGIRFFPGLTG